MNTAIRNRFGVISTTGCIFILLLISACFYDSEEYLYPQIGNSCDTTAITFSGSVKPILQTYCYICHSNATSSFGNNIKLEDYTDVKIKVDDNSLFGSVNFSTGYSPMPKNSQKIDDCKIAIIKKWVEAGAPNN